MNSLKSRCQQPIVKCHVLVGTSNYFNNFKIVITSTDHFHFDGNIIKEIVGNWNMLFIETKRNELYICIEWKRLYSRIYRSKKLLKMKSFSVFYGLYKRYKSEYHELFATCDELFTFRLRNLCRFRRWLYHLGTSRNVILFRNFFHVVS